MRRNTLAIVLACLVLVWAGDAYAGFDMAEFAEMQNDAAGKFATGDYEAALVVYVEMRRDLSRALERNEIDEEFVGPARDALITIQFQLARCSQLTGACNEAFIEFDALRANDTLPDKLVVLLPTRMAESSYCIVETSLAGGDAQAAAGNLTRGDELLAEARTAFTTADLPDNERTEVKADIARVDAARTVAAENLFDHHASLAATKASAGECAAANVEASLASSRAPDSRTTQLAETLEIVGSVCASDGGALAWYEPAGAISLVAIGAGALIGFGVVEGISAGKLTDYDDAVVSCNQSGERCLEAVDLEDELATNQLVSGILVGVGAASLTAGIIWWAVAQAGSDDPATALVPSWTPDGVALSFHTRF